MRTSWTLALPSWILIGTAAPIAEASEVYVGAAPARADDLVPAPSTNGCSDVWRTWPAVQQTAVERGTVVVFDLVSRVGNAFFDLRSVIEVSRWLESPAGDEPRSIVEQAACRPAAAHQALPVTIFGADLLHRTFSILSVTSTERTQQLSFRWNRKSRNSRIPS